MVSDFSREELMGLEMVLLTVKIMEDSNLETGESEETKSEEMARFILLNNEFTTARLQKMVPLPELLAKVQKLQAHKRSETG